ncbi:MAG: DUF222 domain-containing protein, partial [Nocardioidaceae bacterium]
MFDGEVDGLDADQTLSALRANNRAIAAAQAYRLALAAHVADLYAVTDTDPDGTGARPVVQGAERLVQLGGDGTPAVAEFAPAEVGPELGITSYAATRLIADALDLRHRLPVFWARIGAGEVSVRAGRMVAVATRHLGCEAAGQVDAHVACYADSLCWAKLERFLTAEVVAADPELAHERAQQAAETQGVQVLASNDCGIKTAIIRTQAANLVWFDARIDQIADALATRGDARDKDVRRADAVGIIANPHAVLDLLTSPDQTVPADQPEQPGPADQGETSQASGVGADDANQAGPSPSADTSTGGAEPCDGEDFEGEDAVPGCEPAASDDSAAATEDGAGPVGPGGFPRRATRHGCGCHTDPNLSRPNAILYLHLHEDAINGGTHQVARLEGVGPITLSQAFELLGRCQVAIKPV